MFIVYWLFISVSVWAATSLEDNGLEHCDAKSSYLSCSTKQATKILMKYCEAGKYTITWSDPETFGVWTAVHDARGWEERVSAKRDWYDDAEKEACLAWFGMDALACATLLFGFDRATKGHYREQQKHDRFVEAFIKILTEGYPPDLYTLANPRG